jgi:hypothetical protein
METNNQKINTLRGKLDEYKDGCHVFTPAGQGSPQLEFIKGDKGGKKSSLARTTGEKTQSLIARLRIPADAPDPTASLYDELENLVKALPISSRKATLKGRKLMDNDHAKVCLNMKDGRIEMAMTIDLRESIDFIKNFNSICMEINKCLYYNSTTIQNQCRALASSSTK